MYALLIPQDIDPPDEFLKGKKSMGALEQNMRCQIFLTNPISHGVRKCAVNLGLMSECSMITCLWSNYCHKHGEDWSLHLFILHFDYFGTWCAQLVTVTVSEKSSEMGDGLGRKWWCECALKCNLSIICEAPKWVEPLMLNLWRTINKVSRLNNMIDCESVSR